MSVPNVDRIIEDKSKPATYTRWDRAMLISLFIMHLPELYALAAHAMGS